MNNQMVLVVGGPGGSGSSTISKLLAKHFNIERIYGGEYFRQEAKSNGYQSLELFLQGANESMIREIDAKVDNTCRELVKKGNIIIESKVFAGIATLEKIDCTAKIWLTASLEVRAKRVLGKEGIKNPIRRFIRKKQIMRDLEYRQKYDGERYSKLYGIDYSSPEKYNDLVIDSSDQKPEETFNLIVKFLENGGRQKQE